MMMTRTVVTSCSVLALSGIWLLLHRPLATVSGVPPVATKKRRILRMDWCAKIEHIVVRDKQLIGTDSIKNLIYLQFHE
jgi:hypothetical protein